MQTEKVTSMIWHDYIYENNFFYFEIAEKMGKDAFDFWWNINLNLTHE